MRISSTLLLAALASLSSAQNPFTFTSLTSITAGTPFNITWAPSTGTTDTITLVLRQGVSTALTTVETIAPSIQNTGSYLWTPPTSIVKGTSYAFEIIDDGNTAITNYSNEFSIDSTNTVSSAIPSTSASGSTTAGSTSGSTSGSATVKTTSTGSSATGTSSGTKTSATGSSTGTTTGSAAAAATTSGKSAAGTVEVGVGLLAVVGAVMALL